MKIAVFGMGKIGLPLAVQYARKGHEVVGVDTLSSVVDTVNSGTEPFPGEALLHEFLADAVVVAVPLYVDAEARPDFRVINAVAAAIGDSVGPGTLVSFETTLPVGTTRDRIAPEIARRSSFFGRGPRRAACIQP